MYKTHILNTVHQSGHNCYHILIERVLHRFTRMIPGFSKLPYCERLKRLGLWSLEKRRNRAHLIAVFKMVKGLSGILMESMFELSTTKHLRGHELKLTKHRSKLEVRWHLFTERLDSRLNSLDHHTVNASTVNSFKNGQQRLKQSRMGFFEDWSPTNPIWLHKCFNKTGVATPDKWPGNWHWQTGH